MSDVKCVMSSSIADLDPDPKDPHHFAGSESRSIIFFMDLDPDPDPDPDLNLAHCHSPFLHT